MTVVLTRRAVDAVERMDGPCDEARLFATYRRFAVVNRVVAGWRRLYIARLRPLLSPDRVTTLLDVGFGAGDIPRRLDRWARADGLSLSITAVDPDERALRFVRSADGAGGIRYRRATSGLLVQGGERYDIVVSNHLLHHLSDDERDGLLDDSDRLARLLVVHNDIARSRAAYALYAVGAAALAAGSFVREDGLISIRRSYTADELAALVPAPWRVERRSPFRLLLTLDRTGRRPAGDRGR